MNLTIVGWETHEGLLVCLECSNSPEQLEIFRVGELVRRIVKPSVNGQRVHTSEAEGYDRPCGLCGTAIR